MLKSSAIQAYFFALVEPPAVHPVRYNKLSHGVPSPGRGIVLFFNSSRTSCLLDFGYVILVDNAKEGYMTTTIYTISSFFKESNYALDIF